MTVGRNCITGERIVIIGCSGSGKSTLAVKLGQLLNIPVIHLDKLYWNDQWQPIGNDAFDELLEERLNQKQWIIDGNFNRTLHRRFSACDTVVYLDYPTVICLYGALCRVVKYYGMTRPNMGTGCPERIDLGFFKWILTFNRTYRKIYHEMLKEDRDKNVCILKSRKECAAWLQTMQNEGTAMESTSK